MTDSKSQRNYALDALKILATIIIVFHHFQQWTGVSCDNFISFFNRRFYWGYLVELFFILSGYFVYHHIPRIETSQARFSVWYFSRAKRLLPLVAASTVVYDGFLYIYQNVYGKDWMGQQLSLFDTLIVSLGLQEGGAFYDAGINGHTWYISVLLICYAVFYILTAIAGRLKCSPMYLYTAMVFLGCSIIKAGLALPFLGLRVGRGYYAFFFGILLAQFIRRHGHKRNVIVSALAVCTTVIYLFIEHPNAVKEQSYVLTFLLYPSVIILFETKLIQRMFRAKFWGVWGQVSYNVYIWHVPFLILMAIIIEQFNLMPDFTQLKYMLAYTVFIEIIGVLSFYFVEKPLNNFVDHFLD